MTLAKGHPFSRMYNLVFTAEDGSTLNIFTKQGGYHALDIKFDVDRALGALTTNGRISVLGLTKEHIKPFADMAGYVIGGRQGKMNIKLTAGYYEGGFKEVEIYNGGIKDVEITKPPDIWLNLTVNEAWRYTEPIKDPSLIYNEDKYKVEYVAASVVEKYGYRFKSYVDNEVSKTQVPAFPLDKDTTFLDALSKLQDIADWYLFAREGIVYAYPKDIAMDVPGTIKVDNEHGLVGVSGINGINADVTTFLQDQHPDLCKMKLTSITNPGANGTYRIMRKRFHGHFRGDEWYTTYHCCAKVESTRK